MSSITFNVVGIPKAQPRPRAFARMMGGKAVARVYDSGTAEGWKGDIAAAAKDKVPTGPWTGPIRLALTVLMPRPRSHYRGKSGVLKANAPHWHTSKPDADNLVKAVKDCLTVLGFWNDDGQVASVEVAKSYTREGERPGAVVCISQLT